MFNTGAQINDMISNIMGKKRVNFGDLQVEDMGNDMIMLKMGDTRLDMPMDVMRRIMAEFDGDDGEV